MLNLRLEVGQHLRVMVPYADRMIQCEAQVLTAAGPVVMITPPARHRVKVPVQSDHVILRVPGRDALYEVPCPFEELERDMCSVTLPGKEAAKRIQRRRFVRVSLNRSCTLILDPLPGVDAGPPISGELVDLSGGGCAVRTDHSLGQGASVTVVCSLVEGQPPERLRGTIVRCFHASEARLIAIEFKGLAASEQAGLVQLVQSFDLARKRDGGPAAAPSRGETGAQPKRGKGYDRSRFKDWYR